MNIQDLKKRFPNHLLNDKYDYDLLQFSANDILEICDNEKYIEMIRDLISDNTWDNQWSDKKQKARKLIEYYDRKLKI